MSDNELFIWLGFLALAASIVALWYITGKRKEIFSDISQRELGAKEHLTNIIYILILIFISGFLVFEIATLASGVEESMSEMFSFRHAEQIRWPYISLCFTVLCFAILAGYNEFLLIQRMKDARRKLLLGELPEEEEFSNFADSKNSSTKLPKSKTESDEPATFAAVLQAMDLQLKQAIQAAEDLKSELDETKEKVVSLEIEVQEKDSEIKQIKESKSHFDKMIQESAESKNDSNVKSLSIADSVMVGDTIMGGVKIDKQINNDPEAIARAVIEAYRMGKNDE
ncbi:MAG: hypothetical protein DWC02_02840 [Candidatus Poseidoniales archaeon]|nr:MAG: hypothetical protein DWC02_02840 [Candidatus Poseidoniales archaeon]